MTSPQQLHAQLLSRQMNAQLQCSLANAVRSASVEKLQPNSIPNPYNPAASLNRNFPPHVGATPVNEPATHSSKQFYPERKVRFLLSSMLAPPSAVVL